MNEKEPNRTITGKQDKAITSILESKSISAGLRKADIGKTTFYGWMREDELFRAELERRRKELTEEGYHMLKISVMEAASTILELLKNAQGEAVRLRAAESVLERVSKITELEDMERRLTELERSLKR